MFQSVALGFERSNRIGSRSFVPFSAPFQGCARLPCPIAVIVTRQKIKTNSPFDVVNRGLVALTS